MPQGPDPFDALRRALSRRAPRRILAPGRSCTSVALILAGARPRDLAVLLMERVQHPHDPWSGHVALPGGHSEPEDADRLATALRETEEETGLRLRPEDLLGELDDLSPRTATYPELAVRPFVFGLLRRPACAPGPEAAECFWVRLDGLPPAVCAETFVIAGQPRRLPAFKLGNRIVWGITYRILRSLLELARL
ncbi:MAG: CoA pyrophosphatase [Elusimicrobia bacterium]|nr:CoA pyrophosphatase [Elusimicrobiota bacterium]